METSDTRFSLSVLENATRIFSRLLGVACEDREGLADNLPDTTNCRRTTVDGNKPDVTKMLCKKRESEGRAGYCEKIILVERYLYLCERNIDSAVRNVYGPRTHTRTYTQRQRNISTSYFRVCISRDAPFLENIDNLQLFISACIDNIYARMYQRFSL